MNRYLLGKKLKKIERYLSLTVLIFGLLVVARLIFVLNEVESEYRGFQFKLVLTPLSQVVGFRGNWSSEIGGDLLAQFTLTKESLIIDIKPGENLSNQKVKDILQEYFDSENGKKDIAKNTVGDYRVSSQFCDQDEMKMIITELATHKKYPATPVDPNIFDDAMSKICTLSQEFEAYSNRIKSRLTDSLTKSISEYQMEVSVKTSTKFYAHTPVLLLYFLIGLTILISSLGILRTLFKNAKIL